MKLYDIDLSKEDFDALMVAQANGKELVVENGKVIDKIRVEHMNLSGNRSGKMQFHSQRYAYDLDYIFDNIIIPHERGKRVYQKAFRIKKLLAENI